MTAYNFINLMTISPWLIWNSFLCFYVLTLDKSFPIIISSPKQLYKYLAYVVILLSFSMYIFLIRFNNVGKTVNIKNLWKEIYEMLKSLSWLEGIIFFCFGVLVIIFWVMFTRVIVEYFRKCILALYIYYFQYNYFREICYRLVDICGAYTVYLIRRVSIFTKNIKIIGRAHRIWPIGIDRILTRLYLVILPYLIVFDIIVQDGKITKFFVILPWFYLYCLFNGFWYMFHKLFNGENHDLTEEAYGIR